VTAASLDTIDTGSALIQQNSFPTLIEQNPSDYPPVFMLHGESDSLLPARQSIRLCNALAGNAESGPASAIASEGAVSRRIACDDRGSELHLVGEGEHTLDLCIAPELCLAGSPASAAATAKAIERMLEWVGDPGGVAATVTTDNGGGGRFDLPWLLALIAFTRIYVKKMIRSGSFC
jgi:hypothetical protein